MTTQTYSGVLVLGACINCGVPFGLDRAYRNERQKDHRSFVCPNGHSQFWPQENTEERLRRELAEAEGSAAAARARAQRAREETEATRRRLSAAKGQITKMRKRAAAGICPCCKRSFKAVRQHMESQHPQEAALVFADAGKR